MVFSALFVQAMHSHWLVGGVIKVTIAGDFHDRLVRLVWSQFFFMTDVLRLRSVQMFQVR